MGDYKKSKLRTARDILSRFQWDLQQLEQQQPDDVLDGIDHVAPVVMVGYEDRVNGPMETPVRDFLPISQGGEIPEHRIMYFRRAPTYHDFGEIIWDRTGRVDRVFGSGTTGSQVHPETIQMARNAMANMVILEEERLERRAMKAKQRARKVQQRVKQNRLRQNVNLDHAAALNATCILGNDVRPTSRFVWKPLPSYTFCEESQSWITFSSLPLPAGRTSPKSSSQDISVLTWNVLFDLFDSPGDSPAEHSAEARWSILVSKLANTNTDVIMLQEVTPLLVKMLLASDLVKDRYSASSSPYETSAVDPCGVLFLWKRSKLKPAQEELGLFGCQDHGRHRALVVALSFVNDTCGDQSLTPLLLGNVHLPSDQWNQAIGGKSERVRQSRHLARRRELSAVLGQMQRIETKLLTSSRRPAKHVISLVGGDFNCMPEDLEDGSFAGGSDGMFTDLWRVIGSGPGMSFDPLTNPRASRSCDLCGSSKTVLRRIDRVYLAKNSSAENNTSRVVPLYARLVGDDMGESVPSDHFGVQTTLRINATNEKRPISPTKLLHHALSKTSIPCPDSLLALTIDAEDMEYLKNRYDPSSSFISPHITLLHGFVDVTENDFDLVVQSIKESICPVLERLRTEPLSPMFSDETLQVWEHRSSASVVACPCPNDAGTTFLYEIYQALRQVFKLCDEQEKHTASGWNPHVHLGKFGSTSSARAAFTKWTEEQIWMARKVVVRSIDMLQRGNDGTFHFVASVPLYADNNKNDEPTSSSTSVSRFLRDAGALSSARAKAMAQLVVSSHLSRTCRRAASSLFGPDVKVSLHLAGSSRLGVALPSISDIDAIVVLKARSSVSEDQEEGVKRSVQLGPSAANEFFNVMSSLVQKQYPGSKVRFRSASDIPVLTLKLFQNFPSVDLLCCCGDDGDQGSMTVNNHNNNNSNVDQRIMDSIHDSDYLFNFVRKLAPKYGVDDECTFQEAYRGALRIIKLWAYRRGIYGTAAGFLGGGGWAIFLAKILCHTQDTFISIKETAAAAAAPAVSMNNDSKKGHEVKDSSTTVLLAHNMASNFFVHAARWPWPLPVTLLSSEGNEEEEEESRRHRDEFDVNDLRHRDGRQTMKVVARPCSRSSKADFGRGSTEATTIATAEELRRAADIIMIGNNNNNNNSCHKNDDTGSSGSSSIAQQKIMHQRRYHHDLFCRLEKIMVPSLNMSVFVSLFPKVLIVSLGVVKAGDRGSNDNRIHQPPPSHSLSATKHEQMGAAAVVVNQQRQEEQGKGEEEEEVNFCIPFSPHTTTRPVILKAWGSSRVLRLVFDLEQTMGDSSLLRPHSRPLRRSRMDTTNRNSGSISRCDRETIPFGFVWPIGLRCSSNREIDRMMTKVQSVFSVDAQSNLPSLLETSPGKADLELTLTCRVTVLDPNDAESLLCQT